MCIYFLFIGCSTMVLLPKRPTMSEQNKPVPEEKHSSLQTVAHYARQVAHRLEKCVRSRPVVKQVQQPEKTEASLSSAQLFAFRFGDPAWH